jgi:protein-S-isoprenylcysteine O-methyltransferase Ste14
MEVSMRRYATLFYGIICYTVFLGTFLYAMGFVAGFAPRAIDGPLYGSFRGALLINALLLLLFAIQHSGMARRGFKEWLTRYVPYPAERSTYVLVSSFVLIFLFWQWRPMGAVVWEVTAPAARLHLHALSACGWLTVLVTTFLINHFDLFGLRQVYFYFNDRPYTPLGFVAPGPYRFVRHPMYVGWLMAFWATPTMGAAHLVFALATTAYILCAIRLEERDLVHHLGAAYADYRQKVPMLVPRFGARPMATADGNAIPPDATSAAQRARP